MKNVEPEKKKSDKMKHEYRLETALLVLWYKPSTMSHALSDVQVMKVAMRKLVTTMKVVVSIPWNHALSLSLTRLNPSQARWR